MQGVGVGVAVDVGVAVGVGVGVGAPDSAQYLPPVFKYPLYSLSPAQTIIWLSVQIAAGTPQASWDVDGARACPTVGLWIISSSGV